MPKKYILGLQFCSPLYQTKSSKSEGRRSVGKREVQLEEEAYETESEKKYGIIF